MHDNGTRKKVNANARPWSLLQNKSHLEKLNPASLRWDRNARVIFFPDRSAVSSLNRDYDMPVGMRAKRTNRARGRWACTVAKVMLAEGPKSELGGLKADPVDLIIKRRVRPSWPRLKKRVRCGRSADVSAPHNQLARGRPSTCSGPAACL